MIWMLWGYCDDLQKALDDSFACTGNHRYDYEKRNITTAQVHVLLDMALAMMIDKTECFWFLESDNSVNHVSKRITSSETESPWIYSELLLAEITQKRLPQEHRSIPINENCSHGLSDHVPSFIYDAKLSQLYELNRHHISDAISNVGCCSTYDSATKRAEVFLDSLYEETGVVVDE